MMRPGTGSILSRRRLTQARLSRLLLITPWARLRTLASTRRSRRSRPRSCPPPAPVRHPPACPTTCDAGWMLTPINLTTRRCSRRSRRSHACAPRASCASSGARPARAKKMMAPRGRRPNFPFGAVWHGRPSHAVAVSPFPRKPAAAPIRRRTLGPDQGDSNSPALRSWPPVAGSALPRRARGGLA